MLLRKCKIIIAVFLCSLMMCFTKENSSKYILKIRNWTKLSRTDTGYVVYAPCDGSTPTINIKHSMIKINWQNESVNYQIDSLTVAYNSVCNIYCYHNKLRISVKWIDSLKTKALWKIEDKDYGTTKWVMCPTNFADQFPFIDNPCPQNKIAEKEFLPIDFE